MPPRGPRSHPGWGAGAGPRGSHGPLRSEPGPAVRPQARPSPSPGPGAAPRLLAEAGVEAEEETGEGRLEFPAPRSSAATIFRPRPPGAAGDGARPAAGRERAGGGSAGAAGQAGPAAMATRGAARRVPGTGRGGRGGARSFHSQLAPPSPRPRGTHT